MFKNRNSIRLKGYDYTNTGYYFVTICVHNKQRMLGKISNGKMIMNSIGQMVYFTWLELCEFNNINIDAFVVMPDHFHAIIPVGATLCGCPILKGQAQRPAPTLSLSNIVHDFKSLTTTYYRQNVYKLDWMPFPGKFWQRNYYERIIRNNAELYKMRQYIKNNPVTWESDDNNLMGF